VKGYLLDTNVISEPDRRRPDHNVLQWFAKVDHEQLHLSAFTQAELRKGIVKLGSDPRAAKIEARLQQLRIAFTGRILPVDDDVLDRWGQIAGAAEARGRPLPGIDALFAATALHHNLILVTRNTRDMKATGVMLFDPWAMTDWRS
jgi:predicted nucleic acid-binding protein